MIKPLFRMTMRKYLMTSVAVGALAWAYDVNVFYMDREAELERQALAGHIDPAAVEQFKQMIRANGGTLSADELRSAL